MPPHHEVKARAVSGASCDIAILPASGKSFDVESLMMRKPGDVRNRAADSSIVISYHSQYPRGTPGMKSSQCVTVGVKSVRYQSASHGPYSCRRLSVRGRRCCATMMVALHNVHNRRGIFPTRCWPISEPKTRGSDVRHSLKAARSVCVFGSRLTDRRSYF